MPDKHIRNGTERLIIENLLDHNRTALIETARGLSEAQARLRLVASLTTPISLIKHAAGAERIWFQRFWAGLDESECDGYSRRDEGTSVHGDRGESHPHVGQRGTGGDCETMLCIPAALPRPPRQHGDAGADDQAPDCDARPFLPSAATEAGDGPVRAGGA